MQKVDCELFAFEMPDIADQHAVIGVKKLMVF